MANLKGCDYPKQINDALIRMDARGTPRFPYSRKDGLSHSNVILTRRRLLLRQYCSFLSKKNIFDKLNLLFKQDLLLEFIGSRVLAMRSAKSREVFISHFSSLCIGLRSKNITIPSGVDYNFFQRCKDEFGARPNNKDYITGRYIDPERFSNILDQIADRSKAAASLQYKLGFRAQEALTIVKKPNKYLKENQLIGVKGKSGKQYCTKDCPFDIEESLLLAPKLSKDQYYDDLKKVLDGNKAHDFRLSFALNHYNHLRDMGISHNKALFLTSQELNHVSGYRTLYYLDRT